LFYCRQSAQQSGAANVPHLAEKTLNKSFDRRIGKLLMAFVLSRSNHERIPLAQDLPKRIAWRLMRLVKTSQRDQGQRTGSASPALQLKLEGHGKRSRLKERGRSWCRHDIRRSRCEQRSQ